MEKQTTGTVISVKKQWWLKVNTKPVRMGTFDGATFPHIIKVKYTVDGVQYIKRKWIGAGIACPAENEQVTVIYNEDNPAKFRLPTYGKSMN
jgi:hypothetical protein